jgi:hypothetical protein
MILYRELNIAAYIADANVLITNGEQLILRILINLVVQGDKKVTNRFYNRKKLLCKLYPNSKYSGHSNTGLVWFLNS